MGRFGRSSCHLLNGSIARTSCSGAYMLVGSALMVLSHLILNDMIKVKGQISAIAICLEDGNASIAALARLFFHELSSKGAMTRPVASTCAHLRLQTTPFTTSSPTWFQTCGQTAARRMHFVVSRHCYSRSA